MKKKEILKKLEGKMKVVSKPDHPNVLKGPDILTYSERRIFGIFFLDATENKKLEDLQMSLAETTLNYPSKQLNYLVITSKSVNNELVTKFEKIFSKVIVITDLFKDSIYKEKQNESFKKNIKDIQLKYLTETSTNFNYNFELIKNIQSNKTNKDYKKLKELFNKYEKSAYSNFINDNVVKTRSNIFNVNDFIVAFKNIDNSTSDKIDIKPYYKFGVFNDIHLSNESIEFKVLKSKYFDIDKIPTLKTDPYKLVRILSSVGWKLVLENNIETIIKEKTNE